MSIHSLRPTQKDVSASSAPKQPMDTQYERDVVAWAREQAALLRSGCLDRLDLPHIADEIESVGTSEQREFARRLSVLLMHLLK